MPTYTNYCSKCSGTFETFQKITESTVDICQLCGEGGCVERVIQPSNFILKGNGWSVPQHQRFDRNKGRKRTADSYSMSAIDKEREKDERSN